MHWTTYNIRKCLKKQRSNKKRKKRNAKWKVRKLWWAVQIFIFCLFVSFVWSLQMSECCETPKNCTGKCIRFYLFRFSITNTCVKSECVCMCDFFVASLLNILFYFIRLVLSQTLVSPIDSILSYVLLR